VAIAARVVVIGYFTAVGTSQHVAPERRRPARLQAVEYAQHSRQRVRILVQIRRQELPQQLPQS